MTASRIITLEDHMAEHAQQQEERARARVLLRKLVDLAAFPTELVDEFITLAPPLYNPGTRRFEFQRTPNKFPSGQLVFGAAGILALSTAVPIIAGQTGTQDLTPADQSQWRVLGGIITMTASSFVQLRQVGGARSIAIVRANNNAGAAFWVPGNGVPLDPGTGIEIASTVASTIAFTLFIAEEMDTTGRSGS